MKIRFKSFLMFMLLACTTVPYASAYDFSAVNDDGVTIYYNILSEEDKTCEVTYKEEPSWQAENYSGEVNIYSSVIYNGSIYTVKAIGDDAFNLCKNLTSINIPRSVTSIGNSAFFYCSGLTSITIPNSVTSIGGAAFVMCGALVSINIPNSVTAIGNSAFYSCISLTSIDIPNSVSSISNSSLSSSGLTSITIPNSVTAIEDNAFYICSSLTSINIPNSVTAIGDYAFGSCSALTSITIQRAAPIDLTNFQSAFYEVGSNCTLYVPTGSKEAYSKAAVWKQFKIEEFEQIQAESVTFNKSSITLKTGENETLSATILPEGTTEQIIWSSSNPNVATVYANGLIAAINKGTATITATCGSVSATCAVSVEYTQTITDFLNKNAEILNKSTETVKSSDIDAINKALDDYSKLTYTDKEVLTTKKILLYSLKKKIEEEEAAAQAEANKFKADYESVLSETVASVDLANKEAVNKAIEDYAKLSERAKEIEKTDYEHLVELQKELNRLENEIAGFKENSAQVLSKTVDDVKSSDLDLINGVLADFDKLSTKAKTALANEKKHLDELLAAAEAKKKAEEEEAAAQAAANKFKTDYDSVLSETVATVDLADKETVNKAIEDYSKLSERAKEIEKTDYDHLVELQKELNRLENEIADFKKLNSLILSKTVEDVKSSDLDLINGALAEFDKLSSKAKTALGDEKKHLDELLVAAEAKKKAEEEEARVQAEVTNFKIDNAYVLSRTAESVQSNDLDAINKALADYEKLSDKAKEALKDTKAKLDELKKTAEQKKQEEEQEEAVQAEIANFKLDNAYILSRSVENVQSSDLAAIDKALSDFDKLSDAAKAVLANQKELLDSLKEKAEAIKKAEEEAAAVEKEVTEFCYENGEVLLKTTDDVTPDDLDDINKAIEEYEKLSDRAKDELTEVKKHLDELKEEAEAQKQTAEEVKNFKDENKDILDKTVDDVTADDLDDINKALEDYEKLSDRAKDELADEKKHLDELKEEAEAQKQTAEEVKNFKDENKDILDKTVDDVTADDLDDINKALEDYEKLSDRAKDELSEVKKHLDELKDKAEGAGVDTIGADDDQNVKTYNLQGHEVSNNAKGLVIQNGKKIYKK